MDTMLRGALDPGTWLRQDVLASELGVSKIPVREALQRLTAMGLLRVEENRGIVVPRMTAADADENYTLRRSIEVELLRRAVPRINIVDLAEAEMAMVSGGRTSPTAANWAFHRALYRASGWSRGLAMAEILHASMAPYVLLYLASLGGQETSDDEHAALLAACKDGDVEQAVMLLDTHMAVAAAALMAFLDEDDDGDGADHF